MSRILPGSMRFAQPKTRALTALWLALLSSTLGAAAALPRSRIARLAVRGRLRLAPVALSEPFEDASAGPDEDTSAASGFFAAYGDDELASLLEVHTSLFPDAASLEDFEPGPSAGKQSLHELIIGTLAEENGGSGGDP
ncbi:hypothetical protein T492DRAFT_361918 [Pavlovales sp. CCMP2436]|nr:hypothetical protein T492DRAFT_361918 [Pavlovales sp. CCMP2436]